MASFEERIYELGSQALAEQERHVADVGSRGSILLAAAAVVASLLAGPVFDGGHPHGAPELLATGIGLLGSAGVLVFVVLLLRPYALGFSVKASATYRALWDQGILEQPMVDWPGDRRRASLRELSDPREEKKPSSPAAEQRAGSRMRAQAAPDHLQPREEGRFRRR